MLFPENSIIFEGITSVSAVINSIRNNKSNRQVLNIYFDETKIKKEHGRYLFLKAASSELGIPFHVVSSSDIAESAMGKTHGGILAEVTEAKYKDITPDDIALDRFYAIIEGVEDPYSLGYSLRALYACGREAVILPLHLPSAADSTLCKASAGASELLNIYVADTASAAAVFKSLGYKIACAAIPESEVCYDADLCTPLLLVIGGEKRGISSKLMAMKDLNIRIPYGREFMGSLSTASAVSILSYEILRQNSKIERLRNVTTKEI